MTMYEEAVQTLQPTVLLLRVFGVCPSALRRVYIPTSNKIYGTIIIILPTTLYFTQSISAFISFDTLISLALVVYYYLTLVQHMILVVSSFTSSHDLVRFFKIMDSAQQSLFNLNIRQPFKPSTISQILWLLLMFSPVVFLLAWVSRFGIKSLVISFTMHMVRTATLCKIRVSLDLVNEKFYLLNWHLDNLNNRQPILWQYYPNLAPEQKSDNSKSHEEMFILNSNNCKVLTAEKVRNFNKVHLKLFYALKTLNDVFSLPMLVLILASAVAVAADSLLFLNIEAAFRTRMYGFFILALFMVNHLMNLIIVMTMATKVREKSEETAVLVHDLLDEDHHPSDVVEELESFSLSLVHRKVSLTACGFFVIDLKIVSKMAGILAPIIIFLIQNGGKPASVKKVEENTSLKV